MGKRVAIIYNQPLPSRYDNAGEFKAVEGVMESVVAVDGALRKLGYSVKELPLLPPAEQAEEQLAKLQADAVFNLFEGFCGQPETEALIPELLAKQGMPFTGCPAKALRLALDKASIKVLLKNAGIPTPDFQLLNPEMLHAFQLGYPCIVKPRSDDASHGIGEASVVNNSKELEEQVRRVSSGYGSALVEEFIGGREFNATVLGDGSVLPPSEIAYTLPEGKPRLLTFDAKWAPDSLYYRQTQVVCPAKVDAHLLKYLRETALAAFRLLGCRGYARVDMRLDSQGWLNVIEVNPNPDISPEAGAARQAQAAGMDYKAFIGRILQLALEKKEHEHQDSLRDTRRQTRPDEPVARHARVQAV